MKEKIIGKVKVTVDTESYWKHHPDLKKLANKYGVKLKSVFWPDYGEAKRKTITLGWFTDPEWELATFYHELGHVINKRNKRKYQLCTLSAESMAWETGLDLAWKDGYKWKPESNIYPKAKECLMSYIVMDDKTYDKCGVQFGIRMHDVPQKKRNEYMKLITVLVEKADKTARKKLGI